MQTRVALRVAHQHRLERRSVDRPPQHLSCLAGVALDLPHRVEQAREQRVGDLFAHRRRQIGHLMRVGDQPAVVLVGQLLAAKRRQPQLRNGRRASGLVEVGEVPRRHGASRSVENQRRGLGHDVLSVSHPGMAEIDWRRQALLATTGNMAMPPMPMRTASNLTFFDALGYPIGALAVSAMSPMAVGVVAGALACSLAGAGIPRLNPRCHASSVSTIQVATAEGSTESIRSISPP